MAFLVTVVHLHKHSDRRQDRHLVKDRRSAFEAFKLILRGSDYFLTITSRVKITYIMMVYFVSASVFRTSTGEGGQSRQLLLIEQCLEPTQDKNETTCLTVTVYKSLSL